VGTGRFQNLTQGAKLVSSSNGNRDLGFTGDGSEIWMRGPPPAGRRFRLLPLIGGAPRFLLGEKAVLADWSPDGKRLVYFTNDPGDPVFVSNNDGSNAHQIFVGKSDVKRYFVPNVRALMPRFGGRSLFYLSSPGGNDGLWRLEDGQNSEIWRGSEGTLLEPAAASMDGRQAVVVLRNGGKRTLRLVAADGSQVRPLAETFEVRGSPSWSPDGKWIVAAGNDNKVDGLFKIPVDGGAPVRLTTGVARNPVWSRTGHSSLTWE
jgi:Tol biopolymer transport system component